MHKNLIIDNFKCFSQRKNIILGDISILLGGNSVGKSTVIQSILLIRQIYEKTKQLSNSEHELLSIQLNDYYGLQLGDAEHIKSSVNKDEITLEIDGIYFYLISSPDNAYELQTRLNCDLKKIRMKKGLFSDDFYYLSAERMGPRNYQIIDSREVKSCGIYGENTGHYFYKHVNDTVDEKLCFKKETATSLFLQKQVEYWMDYIVPGINIRTDELLDLRLSKIQYKQHTLDTDFLSPYSFGFGISYTLPIIITGLSAKKDSVLIVENPEAHLHPLGQSHIGYFLAKVSFSGVQVIVETHSEHVVNGIRIAALEEKIEPNRLSLNYFSIEDMEDVNSIIKYRHSVEHISLNNRMDIEKWPTGFFDQEENDLEKLRMLRREV